MDARQQRGLELAATRAIRKKSKGVWIVPSQAGPGTYTVNLAAEQPTCSCPDYETRQMNCKHIFAVTFVMKREENSDGSITETLSVTATRKSYPQNWPAYNAAQTNEQDRFQQLLRDLCSGIPEPPANPKGRPPLPLCDAVFSATFKVYSTVSSRRFMSDLRESHQRGYISRLPHYNSICNYLEDDGLTDILRGLITQSSLPLKAMETDFAVDSSGFSTRKFVRWYDHKYGRVRQQHEWVKAHLMCGVKTNIVTAVEIAGRHANDSPFLAPMVRTTARNFAISEVSADKGYASAKNMNAIAAVGGTPFIAYKKNDNGAAGGLWEHMFHYFMFRREEFLQHYHKRSNVESTFSMIKRKFGDALRSKSDTAMVNETLCKVLCHNLVVLIHETHELGIEPVFWAETTPAQQVTLFG
jgi:transposase